jgi:hypothetical protein
VVEVNGDELGRARFYLMEGVPEGGELTCVAKRAS